MKDPLLCAATLRWLCLFAKVANSFGDAFALAQVHPDDQFIGMDYQGERIWYGAKIALDSKLDNAIFLRAFADKLLEFFPKHTVNQIILPFPDPYPRKSDSKKRLTSKHFLEIYQKLLKDNGQVLLKTDSQELFDFTKEELEVSGIKFNEKTNRELIAIQTHYEEKAKQLGKPIRVISFSF